MTRQTTVPQKPKPSSRVKISRLVSLSVLLNTHTGPGRVILVKSDLLNDYLKIDLIADKGIRADILKNKVLKYLRIERDERQKYFLSRFQTISSLTDSSGMAIPYGSGKEIMVADLDIIEGA